MWCPRCKKETICSVIRSFPDEGQSHPWAQTKCEAGIHSFERKRRCLTCNEDFDTAEIDHDLLVELWKLRDAMRKIATDAGKVQELSGTIKTEAEALLGWQKM